MSENKKIGELDLIAMAIKVLKEWKLMLKFGFVGGIVGVIVAFSLPKYWTSEVDLAPEFSSGSMSGLSGNLADLASSFGVDLGSGGSMDAIYPDLYPNVLSSTDFLMNLYNVPIRTMDDPTLRPYIQHLTVESKIPFWRYPAKWFAQFKAAHTKDDNPGVDNDPFWISRRDWDRIKVLRKSILCTVDRKSSVISIAVVDQDPMAAAIIADTVKNRLQSYITDYRTGKIRLDVQYYTEQVAIAKEEYDKALDSYAKYADSNIGLSRVSLKTVLDDLEADMELKQSIYRQTVTMLKQSEAKLQERTPSFSTLQRPVTPYRASSLPRIVVCLLWACFFGMIGALWVLFGRTYFNKINR